MRTAVGDALSTVSTARLPHWLFERSEASPQETTSHWLFVPSPTGYTVREQGGRPPARGHRIQVDGVEYRVAVVGDSPLRDGRSCAYLQH